MKLTNHTSLIKSGQATRFGPSWPGRRCGAKTRAGGPCQNPSIKNRARCKLHGGASVGPRTPKGKETVRQINIRLRRVLNAMRRQGIIP